MKDISKLPSHTADLWSRLENEPFLSGAFLVGGGTALALQIGHRKSLDLDFAFTSLKLPRHKLATLISSLEEKGFHFSVSDNPAACDEFVQGGGDLHDHQQDFIVNGVTKVSFFSLDAKTSQVIATPAGKGPIVPAVSDLFALKCMVLNFRSKSRDWLDLYVLMKDHGFTIAEMRDVYVKADSDGSFDFALNKLCSIRSDFKDEGYEALLPNPPSLEQMRSFFSQERDKFETALAAKRFKEIGNH